MRTWGLWVVALLMGGLLPWGYPVHGSDDANSAQQQEVSKDARLFVETVPKNTRIRVLTIRPKFFQGMVLNPGPYQIEISKSGFETRQHWITLLPGEVKRFRVHLAKIPKVVIFPDSTRFVNTLGMSFTRIEPGSFVMGSPPGEPGRGDDEKEHKVTLTKAFFMGETEVTHGQWGKLMGNNPAFFKNCGDDCPIETVSWLECQEFIRRLNEREQTDKYRLPLEAEWEYACRAQSMTALYTGPLTIVASNTGPALDDIAWYGGNSCATFPGAVNCSKWVGRQYPCDRCGPQPVGQKKPNKWGLFDMLGSVWEWCEDWHGEYPAGPVTDPAGAVSGDAVSGGFRVLRGGSWENYASACRSAARDGDEPTWRDYMIGFRVVRDVN